MCNDLIHSVVDLKVILFMITVLWLDNCRFKFAVGLCDAIGSDWREEIRTGKGDFRWLPGCNKGSDEYCGWDWERTILCRYLAEATIFVYYEVKAMGFAWSHAISFSWPVNWMCVFDGGIVANAFIYTCRDTARYNYTHEILANDKSTFKGQPVPKSRRISVICRNKP